MITAVGADKDIITAFIMIVAGILTDECIITTTQFSTAGISDQNVVTYAGLTVSTCITADKSVHSAVGVVLTGLASDKAIRMS